MSKQKSDGLKATSSANLLAKALSWAKLTDVAIATVIDTWGSAPRPKGSIMIIKNADQFEGSVSGGCVEGAVLHSARAVLKTGKAECLEFGVSNEDAINIGLACGGTIRVLVEKLDKEKQAQINEILKSLDNDNSAIWLKPTNGLGKSKVVLADKQLNTDASYCEFEGDEEKFYHIFTTPLKIAVIGAVHIAQELAPIAKLTGFDVEIIDPRAAFASAERMQGCKVTEAWPDEALRQNPPTARTAIVTLTHDPKLDDAALEIALKSDAFYIGCLGSKKTHAKRIERLSKMGFSEGQLKRIHGPVGLNIGAKSPAEIAIAIVAEIIATYREEK